MHQIYPITMEYTHTVYKSNLISYIEFLLLYAQHVDDIIWFLKYNTPRYIIDDIKSNAVHSSLTINFER